MDEDDAQESIEEVLSDKLEEIQLHGSGVEPAEEETTGETVHLTASGPTGLPMDVLVDQIIAGLWGNGLERRARIKAAGYDFIAVQTAVNATLRHRR